MVTSSQIVLGMRRGWMATGNALHCHVIQQRHTSRALEHAERFRKLSETRLDQALEELRARLTHHSITTSPREIARARSRFPFGAISLSRRSRPLLLSAKDYDFAVESVGIATVLMERSMSITLHPNQITAILALAEGRVIQLDTGEGKTFVGAVRAFLDNLWGQKSTVLSPNGYLASRDAQWLEPFYSTAGIRVACADGVDGMSTNPGAYQCDVCYVSLPRLMFDGVHNVTCHRIEDWIDIPLGSVIVDEIDAVLLDSGSFGHAVSLDSDLAVYRESQVLADQMQKETHYKIQGGIHLTADGYKFLAQKQANFRRLHALPQPAFQFHIRCALEALHEYQRDRHYIVADGRIVLIDHDTGRKREGASLGLGVQQAVEMKEGLPLSLAQCFVYTVRPVSVIGRAQYLCGMSGSAASERIAFRSLYGLPVAAIPPHRFSLRKQWPDEIFWRREYQFDRVVELTRKYNEQNQPVLVGTQAIRDAEELAHRLEMAGLPVKIITAKNDFDEARIIRLAGYAGAVTVAARMAGRGVDIVVDRAAQDAGGLAVISAGRFQVRRLDNQFAGRTGRQGENGEVHFLLSLDDENFKEVSQIQFIQRMFGNERDSVSSRQLDWNIRQYQSRRRDAAFAGLAYWLEKDRLLAQVRDEYEQQRFRLLGSDNLEQFIKQMMDQTLRSGSQQLLEWLQTQTRISLAAEPGPLADQRRERAVRELFDEYQNRKLATGPLGPRRERLILLLCFDFQWAILHLDWTRHLEMAAPTMASAFHDMKFLGQRAANFHREFAEQALHYLFCIDQSDVLQRCYYWRGTLLPSSADAGTESTLDQWGDVPVPAEQIHLIARPRLNPLSEETLETANAEVAGAQLTRVPPKRPAKLDLPSPALEALRVREDQLQRWRNILTVVLFASMGGAVLWWLSPALEIHGFQGLTHSPDHLDGRGLLSGIEKLLFMHSLGRSPGLAISLPVVALTREYYFRHTSIRTDLALLALTLLVALVCYPWAGNHALWAYLGSVVVYASIVMLAARLLQVCRLSLFTGLAFVSGVLLLLQNWQHSESAPSSLAAPAIAVCFAVSSALTIKRFHVQAFQGWDHTSNAQMTRHHTYAVGALEDVLPLAMAWLWVSLVSIPVLALLGRFGVVAQPTLTAVVLLVAYCLIATFIALRRSSWKFDPALYQTIEWKWKGTLASGKQSVDSHTLARSIKRSCLSSWLVVLTLASVAACVLVGLANPRGPIDLLTASGLVGVPLGLVLRRLSYHYFGWHDSEGLQYLLPPSSLGSPWHERTRIAFRAQGGWLVWGLMAASLGYLRLF